MVISRRFRYLAYTVNDHYLTFQLLGLSYPCKNPVLDVSITRRFTVSLVIFCRPYYRSSLWYSVSSVCLSVVCLSVCNVLYCGKTVHPSEKVSEGVNRKQGQKVHFWGRRHISTSSFVATATKTAVFALFLLV